MKEVLKWLPGLGLAIVQAVVEYLTAAPTGAIALRALGTLVLLRVLQWAVRKWGPQTATFVLLAVLACTPVEAAQPRDPRRLTVRLIAAGDTATLVASWSVGRSATGYVAAASVTTFGSVSAWTWLPPGQSVTTTARTAMWRAVNSVADSSDFTVCVRSTRGALQSPTQTCAVPRRWIRLPVAPDSVRIDSIGVAALELRSVTGVSSVAVGSSVQYCGFLRLKPSGHVAMRIVDAAACQAIYLASYSSALRAVTADEQAWVDCVLPYACPAGYRRIEGLDPNPLRVGDGS